MGKFTPYLLALPMLIFLGIFLLGIGNALVQSFGYIPAFGLDTLSLDYYRAIFSDANFLASMGLSLYISLASSLAAVALGVLVCAALVYTRRMDGLLLQITRLPILVPHTVAALFVTALFSQSGLLSRLLFHLGAVAGPGDFPNLLYNAGSGGILLGYIWKEAPFVAYFVLAVMSSVGKSLGEAAANLGASPLKGFFTVTLPLSLPAVANAFLIIFAYSFGAYELPFLLGATLPKALPVQAYLAYTHPDLLHRPYAMAMNGVILLLTLALSGLFFLLLQKTTERMGGAEHEK